MVTEERRIEVEQFLARVCAWSLQRPDVVAVALVGSWACGHPGMDSDVDLVVLTTDKPAVPVSSVHRTGGPSTPSAGSCFPRGWR
jgi:predicted nucleotidyltransferase